jgi:hypothetical protein
MITYHDSGSCHLFPEASLHVPVQISLVRIPAPGLFPIWPPKNYVIENTDLFILRRSAPSKGTHLQGVQCTSIMYSSPHTYVTLELRSSLYVHAQHSRIQSIHKFWSISPTSWPCRHCCWLEANQNPKAEPKLYRPTNLVGGNPI